ncbi:hypothetical protein [Agrococcus sp. DT81.2]|uniref:hypothetical protein n=1 Tax=Agrococcus sp. DT81.2 TaxID=3393414 RepID=UPI003CE550D4
MASYQFLADVRRRDPLWYRICEVTVALAIIGSNWLSDTIEDAAGRVWKHMHRH